MLCAARSGAVFSRESARNGNRSLGPFPHLGRRRSGADGPRDRGAGRGDHLGAVFRGAHRKGDRRRAFREPLASLRRFQERARDGRGRAPSGGAYGSRLQPARLRGGGRGAHSARGGIRAHLSVRRSISPNVRLLPHAVAAPSRMPANRAFPPYRTCGLLEHARPFGVAALCVFAKLDCCCIWLRTIPPRSSTSARARPGVVSLWLAPCRAASSAGAPGKNDSDGHA